MGFMTCFDRFAMLGVEDVRVSSWRSETHGKLVTKNCIMSL
jgi:hypothetical protein